VAYDPAAWTNYFIAQAGASAALAGLVFVAVSINLKLILRYPHLPGRVGQALISLLQLLVVALAVLIPERSNHALGVELLVVGILTWSLLVAIQWKSLRRIGEIDTEETGRAVGIMKAQVVASGQLVSLPTIVAGASLLAGGGGGLYWLAAGTLLALVSGISDTWVLLIEIQR
jgi:modulator of FtsH protease